MNKFKKKRQKTVRKCQIYNTAIRFPSPALKLPFRIAHNSIMIFVCILMRSAQKTFYRVIHCDYKNNLFIFVSVYTYMYIGYIAR